MDESSNRAVQKVSVETPDQSRVPDTSVYEGILAGAKIAAQAIPLVGGTIAETLGYLGQQYVDRQMRAFWEGLVSDLDEFKVRLDRLNNTFFSTALYAAQVARITHDAETHEQLRNAALHAAMPGAPDDDLQRIFVTLIASLTPLHIRLLRLILHPEEFDPDVSDWREFQNLHPMKQDQLWKLIEKFVSPRRDLVETCLNDLASRGLLKVDDRNAITGGPSRLELFGPGQPTNLAWDFMAYITRPKPEIRRTAPAQRNLSEFG